jgi:mono/diheme cytochrome c family protein
MIRQLVVGIVAMALSASVAQAQKKAETVPIKPTSIKGAVMFDQYCAVCHGKEGRGDGSYAADLATKPSDLTRISARNGGAFPLVKVERHIDGANESSGTRDMPLWGPLFKSLDPDMALIRTRTLVEHIRTLQTN